MLLCMYIFIIDLIIIFYLRVKRFELFAFLRLVYQLVYYYNTEYIANERISLQTEDPANSSITDKVANLLN